MRTSDGIACTATALAVVTALACAPALGQEMGKSGRTRIEARLPDQAPPATQPGVAARTGQSDPAAGDQGALQSAELSAEEKLRAMTSTSTEGLKTVRLPNGAVGIDLEGRFMHVMVAKEAEDGSLVLSCHHGEDALVHAKHAADIAAGRAPKVKPIARATARSPVPTYGSTPPAPLEEK